MKHANEYTVLDSEPSADAGALSDAELGMILGGGTNISDVQADQKQAGDTAARDATIIGGAAGAGAVLGGPIGGALGFGIGLGVVIEIHTRGQAWRNHG